MGTCVLGLCSTQEGTGLTDMRYTQWSSQTDRVSGKDPDWWTIQPHICWSACACLHGSAWGLQRSATLEPVACFQSVHCSIWTPASGCPDQTTHIKIAKGILNSGKILKAYDFFMTDPMFSSLEPLKWGEKQFPQHRTVYLRGQPHRFKFIYD